MSWSKIFIVGNLGGDPKLNYIADGKAVCNLRVASNRTWRNSDGEKVKETTWFNVAVWGVAAENANKYLRTGSQVHIMGRIKPNDKGNPRTFQLKDGNWSSSFEVTCEEITYLSSGGKQQRDESEEPVGNYPENDEIPF